MRLLKIESIFKLFGYNINKAYSDLLINNKLSNSEYELWKEKKRWDIVKFHLNNNSFYKNKIIGSHIPDNWTDLPIIEKDDFQNNMEDIYSDGYNQKNCYVANTSGSSGHPFFFAKDKYTHARTWAFWKFRYKQLGLNLNSLEARFYGISKEPIGNLTEKAKDYFLNRKRFPIFDLSEERIQLFLNQFKNNSFEYVYGYTSAIVHFSRYLIKKGLVLNQICPSIKLVIVTSEVCTIEDRVLIKEGIGVKVFSEYGTSEVGELALECEYQNWHILDNQVFIESNNNSELLVTDLFNKAQPFIRYKVGDLGSIERNNCSCDNRGAIIKDFNGRVNDLIYLPSGKVAAGLSFYYISRSLLESSGVLKEFIIRQTKLDTFVFDVVAFEKLSQIHIDILKQKIELYLEKDLNIIINEVNSIDRGPSGKIQHFFSELELNKNNDENKN